MSGAEAQRPWSQLMALALVASAAGVIALATRIEANPPPPTLYEPLHSAPPPCSPGDIYFARRALDRMEKHRPRSHGGEWGEWVAAEILKKREYLAACAAQH